jgi:hypothetical protein
MPLAVALTLYQTIESRRDLRQSKKRLAISDPSVDLNNVIVAYHAYRLDQVILVIQMLCLLGLLTLFHFDNNKITLNSLIDIRTGIFGAICLILTGMSVYNTRARLRVRGRLREWAKSKIKIL